ncbi:MAG: glycine betaine ABC transporter substrate-binding protein [Burkholderiaceae bacterium]
MKKSFASFTFLAPVLLTCLIAFAGPVHARNFVIGSKNFTEQYILAEMYAAALEGADIAVERKINLGGTMIAHAALTTGEVDMYPEYTGTALSAVVRGDISTDADKVYAQVKDYYANQLNLIWLKPTRINNGYVIVVRQATAQKNNLKSLSDLAKVANTLVFGGGPEFPNRADGLPGLKRVYNAEFKKFKQFAKLGLRYDALQQSEIDVANGAATDWQIGSTGLVALDDDKGLFPPYNVAPVISRAALAAFPKSEKVLDGVSALLDNAVMQKLNARVEKDKQEPKDVAIEFLRQHGIATGKR